MTQTASYFSQCFLLGRHFSVHFGLLENSGNRSHLVFYVQKHFERRSRYHHVYICVLIPMCGTVENKAMGRGRTRMRPRGCEDEVSGLIHVCLSFGGGWGGVELGCNF